MGRGGWFGVSAARWMLLIAFAITAVLASIGLRGHLELEWSVESLRALVDRAGLWGPVVYIAILAFRFVVLVPSSILLTAAGLCFGALAGTLYATIGLTLSALLKYALASIAGRDFVLRQLSEKWRTALAVGDDRTTVGGLALICAYPFGPKHVFQIAAILSGMPLLKYLLAVGSGAKFRAGAFALLGDAIVTGTGIGLVSVVLAVLACIPLCIPRVRAWLISPRGVHA